MCIALYVLIWFCRSPSGRQWCPHNADPSQFEINEAVLKRRQKQIQYGKNTCGYQNYVQQVPKWEWVKVSNFFFFFSCSPDCIERFWGIIFYINCSGVSVCLGFTLLLQTNIANIAVDLGTCKSASGGERFMLGTCHLLPRKTRRDKTLLFNCKSSKTIDFAVDLLILNELMKWNAFRQSLLKNTELWDSGEKEGSKWDMALDTMSSITSQPSDLSTDGLWLYSNATQVRLKYWVNIWFKWYIFNFF